MGEADSGHRGGRPRKARLTLRAVQVLIVLFAAVIVLGGKGDRAWPMISWPMYRGIHAPAAVLSNVELRGTGTRGEVYTCIPSQLFTEVEIVLAKRLFRSAFGGTDPERRRASRRFLARRLQEVWDTPDLVEVQGYELSWRPAFTAVPPLSRDRPETETLLGRILVSDYTDD